MPRHIVVDGSNIATEGRSMPSLKQLNEAVMAWLAENPNDLVTVVVDATFGHRIDKKEVAEFDEAVANNEIVAPPAGAIGRGDAFVLAIADKVKASVLSNDSYQEFHGEYEWLFDEGRLIGGKPVPHIGWVFVNRVPVRGPLSRKSVRDAKRKGDEPRRGAGKAAAKTASRAASQPMPVPKAPPPGAVAKKPVPAPVAAPAGAPGTADAPPAPARGHHLNDLLSFLGFVEKHPVGTTLSAVVESYSSHGAYVKIGDVVGYVPLRLMADPAPRSARELMAIGEAVTLVVAAFNPGRRGIDLGLPGMVPTVAPVAKKEPKKKAKVVSDDTAAGAPDAPAPTNAGRSRRSATTKAVPEAPPAVEVVQVMEVPSPEPTPAVAKRRRSRRVEPSTGAEPTPKAAKAPEAPKAAKAAKAPRAAKAAPVPDPSPIPPPAEATTAPKPTKRTKTANAAAAPEGASVPPSEPAPVAKRTRAPKVAAAVAPLEAQTAETPKPVKPVKAAKAAKAAAKPSKPAKAAAVAAVEPAPAAPARGRRGRS